MARLVAEKADILAPLAEVFRQYGYEGASLARIGQATGLGKGSLYHFFPGGKDEMLAAVLAEIEVWFETHVFAPLAQEPASARQAIEAMFEAVSLYFHSGRRVCLMGTLALGEERDRFALAISRYFARWVEALATALTRQGLDEGDARRLAEETVAGIQGAIVLSRALDEPAVFERGLLQLRERLRAACSA